MWSLALNSGRQCVISIWYLSSAMDTHKRSGNLAKFLTFWTHASSSLEYSKRLLKINKKRPVAEQGFISLDVLFNQNLTVHRGRRLRAARACPTHALLSKYNQPAADSNSFPVPIKCEVCHYFYRADPNKCGTQTGKTDRSKKTW